MEFTPGQEYYFVSTSSKGDLYQRVGGRCSSHHMKVAFKVADADGHSTTTKKSSVVNVPRPPLLYPPGSSSAEVMDRKELSFMYRHPATSSKKRQESSSHPNEVIK